MLAIFLDIETTGLDLWQHVPIDIAIKVLDLDTGHAQAVYQTVLRQSEEVWQKRDPASMEINGYSFEIVQTGKEPAEVAQEIISLFNELKIQRGKAVFICQNPAFDRAFFGQIIPVYTQEKLNWPYHWLDLASMYWTLFVKELQMKEKRLPESVNLSKNSIAELYGLPAEEHPHHALNGVNHLIACYRAVMNPPWEFF